MIDEGWGHWLAGFWAGEGCFVIQRTTHGGFVCRAAVQLRQDDGEVLYQLAELTGLGKVRECGPRPGRTDNPLVMWDVSRRAECAALVEIFDRFPLRAKKQRDYEIWREAVLTWTEKTWKRGRAGQGDWSAMADLKERLHAGRRYEKAVATAQCD